MSRECIPSAVVLGSGRGSNLNAILHAVAEGRLRLEIQGVISDRPDALILDVARKNGVPALSVPFPDSKDREVHGVTLLQRIQEAGWNPRFLVLAGYMRVLGQNILDHFRSEEGYRRIVNIHPSLLPAFPGLRSYAQAFDYGAKVTGVTVHLVEAGVDQGPVCAQETFSISDCHSSEEVEKRGLQIEHRLFPETLEWILAEKFVLEKRAGGRFCVCKN